MPALLRGVDGDALRALALAGPELPGGALAEAVLDRELGALQRFAARVCDAIADPVLPVHAVTLALDVDGEAWRLGASFGELRPGGLVGWRFGKAGAGDALDAWLQHLVLCAAPPAGVERCTRRLCTDSTLRFGPVDDAARHLAALLAIFREGLRAPLHFFPRASMAFVRRDAEAARAIWRPDPQNPFAEGADAAVRLALRGVADPLDGDFEALAAAVFVPLLDHLAEEPVR
jgi:exodeoxyribonuclease V gamma subunit